MSKKAKIIWKQHWEEKTCKDTELKFSKRRKISKKIQSDGAENSKFDKYRAGCDEKVSKFSSTALKDTKFLNTTSFECPLKTEGQKCNLRCFLCLTAQLLIKKRPFSSSSPQNACHAKFLCKFALQGQRKPFVYCRVKYSSFKNSFPHLSKLHKRKPKRMEKCSFAKGKRTIAAMSQQFAGLYCERKSCIWIGFLGGWDVNTNGQSVEESKDSAEGCQEQSSLVRATTRFDNPKNSHSSCWKSSILINSGADKSCFDTIIMTQLSPSILEPSPSKQFTKENF